MVSISAPRLGSVGTEIQMKFDLLEKVLERSRIGAAAGVGRGRSFGFDFDLDF